MEWIGCIVCEIFAFKLYYVTLKLGFGRGHSLKVIESGTIRQSKYDFVRVFYSNYASVYYRIPVREFPGIPGNPPPQKFPAGIPGN